MGTSKLLGRLKVMEGWSENLYLDTTGHLTIGYGYNLAKLILPPGVKYEDITIVPINGITITIGETLLVSHVMKTAAELETKLPWVAQLDEVRRDVLLDMAYNMGVGSRELKKGLLAWPIFLDQVRTGQYAAAASNMRSTHWCRQIKETRCERLASAMERGIDEG